MPVKVIHTPRDDNIPFALKFFDSLPDSAEVRLPVVEKLGRAAAREIMLARCCDCGQYFERECGKDWKVRCFACWRARKDQHLGARELEPRPPLSRRYPPVRTVRERVVQLLAQRDDDDGGA